MLILNMPSKITGILAAKRLLKKRLARRAARKYTWIWDEIIQESKGIKPKRSNLPPNFVGTNQNQKYNRAKTES